MYKEIAEESEGISEASDQRHFLLEFRNQFCVTKIFLYSDLQLPTEISHT